MTKQGALEELIKSMFNDAELRSFLGQMPDTAPLLAGLPGGSASPLQVMFETIQLLERHEIIDSEFFAALAAARPRRQKQIQEVAALWGLSLPAASETRAPTSSSSTPPNAASTSAPSPSVPTPNLRAPSPSSLPTDVAILIALEEEWKVFWKIAGEPGGVKDDSGGYLYHFEVPTVAGRPYRCVALFMGAMGPGQATHATARLLATRPITLVNIGIAAAIHDDLKLCDVVFAEQVDDFLSTVKAVPKGKDGWAFELRGNVYRTTHALVQDLINLQFAHRDAFTRWRSACGAEMSERAGQFGKALEAKHLRDAPAITNVHLASGPVLAAAEAFSTWVRTTRDGLLKALEMEAAGMMLGAHQQADPARTLVLRGISDFGDERKAQTDRDSGGAFRHLAMFNATQLLWAMLHQGLLPRHEPIAVPPQERAGPGPSERATSPDGAAPNSEPHDPEVDPPWTDWTDVERPQIESILTTTLRDAPVLSRSLETRLALRLPKPVGPLPDDVHARVARRIVSLGRGCAPALALAEDCCRAVFGDKAEARGEQREARKLLEQWLPRGYGGEARVVLLTLSAPSSSKAAQPDARHIEVGTLSPFIAEVHVARLHGRPAAFATRNALVDGQRRPQVEGRARLPTRSAGSEILTGDGIARAIVRSAFKRYLLEPTTSDAMAMLNVVTELETQMELTGLRHYVVFTGKERCDELFAAVIQRLGEIFPELQVVALGEVPGTTDAIPEHIRQETKLLTYLRRIFEDHGTDDDDL